MFDAAANWLPHLRKCLCYSCWGDSVVTHYSLAQHQYAIFRRSQRLYVRLQRIAAPTKQPTIGLNSAVDILSLQITYHPSATALAK